MDRDVLRENHVEERGAGTVPLVFNHGFGTDRTVWRHVAPRFEDDHRVVTLDTFVGPGRTDPFDHLRYLTLGGFADDLVAVLDAIDGGPCVYVGHSVAGMVGLLAAIRRPDRFRKLVLLAPSPCYRQLADYDGGWSDAALDAVFATVREAYATWAKAAGPVFIGDAADGTVQEFVACLLRMRPDVALATLVSIFLSDYRSHLARVAVPVTILQIARDPAVPLTVGRYMADRIPCGDLEVLDLGGHLPHLSAPDLTTDAIRRHLVRD